MQDDSYHHLAIIHEKTPEQEPGVFSIFRLRITYKPSYHNGLHYQQALKFISYNQAAEISNI
ncbi:hypothetical protein BACILLUS_005760 (plasmid) [Priestia megaterium]